MILTTHALTGAVIGKNLDDPFLIIILSLIIHYAMDRLRHGEYLDRKSTWKNTTWKVGLDILVGWTIIGIFLLISYNSNNFNDFNVYNIFLGVFFSMLPDLLTLLYWKFNVKILKTIFDFHAKMHKYPPFSSERIWNLKNARNDIIISILAIILLLI